ncbi:MAG: hypothetical protein D6714_05220 [Bacteroidetes bacterium]|nr:MAG: hypothetical protein D6714_05220 [Bacteroidota bacterium]
MKKLKLLSGSLLLATLLSFGACELINPAEGIPAYVHVKSFTVAPNPDIFPGSLSSKITHASLFVEDPGGGPNQSFGVISLPATVPLLLDGEYDLNFEPVIKANGNSFSLENYPYYQTVQVRRTLVPGEVDTLVLMTQYKKETKFSFIEDFDDGTVKYFNRNLEPTSPNSLVVFEENAFEGKSAKVQLDTANAGFIISTQQTFPIDVQQTGFVYLEVNYKNDIPIEFGVIGVDVLGNENPVFEYIVLEKSEWNKIYLNLSELIVAIGDPEFRFAVRGIIPFDTETGQLSREKAEVWLDNIKLVHF